MHFVRPAAELLFESVALCYHERAIAVVLTGADRDGSSGVQDIKRKGGVVIAQDKTSSQVFGMPATAISTGCVDWIVLLDKIATALKNLVITGEIEEKSE